MPKPIAAVIASLALLTGGSSADAERVGPASIEVVETYTVHGAREGRSLAGQGICLITEPMIAGLYFYGDADPGLIREFTYEGTWIGPTGREIRLTRNGDDIIPHPTGLTFHPEHGCFIGDTVNRRGVIWHIDWERALEDGNLDNAILNQVTDDVAVNGTRPEWVRYDGRWLIATSDYGGEDNELRLYDPERLKEASRTSAAGVLVRKWRCGPFVQSLHWLDDRGQLVLVQNQKPGLLYRLTYVELREDTDDLRFFEPIDLEEPTDELEGFAVLGGGIGVMLSAYPEDNVNVVKIRDD